MNDWNIQSRAHHCQACDAAFEDKQLYHTLLFDDDPVYVRRDICPACWENEFKDREREKGFVSYWQGTYEAPPPQEPEPIQKETAETLLRKLFELNQDRYAPASFILAVMLERKRLLKVKEQVQRNDQRIFIYEHPKSGDIFTIADPALQLDQLEAVQRDVADLLQFGLTPEGEIDRPAPAAAGSEDEAAAEPSRDEATDSTETGECGDEETGDATPRTATESAPASS